MPHEILKEELIKIEKILKIYEKYIEEAKEP